MKKRMISGGLAAMALAIGLLATVPVQAKEEAIPSGISVGGIELGGMSEDAARQKVQEYIDSLAGQRITLDVDGTKVDTTAKDLGFYWSNPDAVEEAVGTALRGNMIARYMAKKDLEKNPVEVPLQTAVDEAKVQAFVEAECAGIIATPSNASIVREDGAFIVTPAVEGKAVDVSATKDALDAAMKEGLESPILVQAAMTEQAPEISTEALESIQDVLGTFSTDFSSSGSSRSGNLANGASKINGHLLMPGEVLSGYECMQPFTKENGYYTAAAYENGQVVDSVGGGVCQIATTLYNAALLAEVDIPQRQNHSMIVTYVKPSMDAAIAGTYKDIKIANNYSTPIYVEGYTSGRTLTFTIYGKETRPDNREIKYVSETLGVTDPGAPTVRIDKSLAPGARRTVQSAHKGLRSRLWKEVYVDGVQTERTLLHTDNYNASKAIVLAGPSAPAVSVAPQPQPPQAPVETPPETQPDVSAGPGAFIGQ